MAKWTFGTLAENTMTIQPLTFQAHLLGGSREEALLFKPISFSLKSGTGIWVEGANGVGKTTLLRVLAGLLPQTCGQISCNLPIRQNVAYLGPHNGVKGLLTPVEYLSYFVKDDVYAHINSILSTLQLKGLEHKPCATLSSGQKQRVALARVVLSKAPLWILDEPMTALDKHGEQLFANLLHDHLTQGGIAIIATHQILNETRMQKLILEPHHV